MPEDVKSPPDPPLVDIKVTNPVTYFKKWWARIIGNEGIDFRLHVRPLTAIFIAVAIASISFGVGRFVLPFNIPFFEYNYTPENIIPVEPVWKDTAYTGVVQYSEATQKYFLVASSSEAITLDVPESVNLERLIGKRILVVGSYSKTSRVLVVKDAKDMEVLPKSPVPLPTLPPTPSLTPEATPQSFLTESPTAQ